MTETRATLDADTAAKLAEFSRAFKAAARAVSLYPAGHPAIGTTLGRLTQLTGTITAAGPFTLEVRPHAIFVAQAARSRLDQQGVGRWDLVGRPLVGALGGTAAADAEWWGTLLRLLCRPAEEVRADGGIAALWATAGGPSLEVIEIDYAEVLREKPADGEFIERLVAAALGQELELDESGLRLLLD